MNIEINNSQKEAFIALCKIRVSQIASTISELTAEVESLNNIMDKLSNPEEQKAEENEHDKSFETFLENLPALKDTPEVKKRKLPIEVLQKEAQQRHQGKSRHRVSREYEKSFDDGEEIEKIKKEDRPPANYSNNKSLYPELNNESY